MFSGFLKFHSGQGNYISLKTLVKSINLSQFYVTHTGKNNKIIEIKRQHWQHKSKIISNFVIRKRRANKQFSSHLCNKSISLATKACSQAREIIQILRNSNASRYTIFTRLSFCRHFDVYVWTVLTGPNVDQYLFLSGTRILSSYSAI